MTIVSDCVRAHAEGCAADVRDVRSKWRARGITRREGARDVHRGGAACGERGVAKKSSKRRREKGGGTSMDRGNKRSTEKHIGEEHITIEASVVLFCTVCADRTGAGGEAVPIP